MSQAATDPNSSFSDGRKHFNSSIDKALAASALTNDKPSRSGVEYWSSVMFTKLVVNAMAIGKLSPQRIGDDSGIWDISSVAILVRSLAENWMMLEYYCFDCAYRPDEFSFRFISLQIMDNRSRYRLLDGRTEQNPAEFEAAQEALALHLKSFAQYNSLSAQQQKDILKGDRLPFVQDEIVDKLNMERVNFRSFYRYLSSYVHTGPVSFIRMETQRRGNGEENDYDKGAIGACLFFAGDVIESATRDFLKIQSAAND